MRQRTLLLGSILSLTVLLAACFQAAPPSDVDFDVLYYYDLYLDSSYSTSLVNGVEADGHVVTETTSAATFDTELASGAYDVAIVLVQDGAVAIDTTAFETFIADGGRAVFVDWTRTASIATVFDASYTGVTGESSADLSGSMTTGITDPMTLTNPGWGTFSFGLTAETGGTSSCTFGNGDSCLVFGNEDRTAILGFLADTLPQADAEQFWINLMAVIEASAL